MASTTQPTTDTTALHALRTIFNLSVVFYHTLVFLSFTLDDPSDASALLTGSISAHVLAFLSTLGNASVDIFLLISGFLLKSSFSDKSPTVSTAVRYTIFRYLRLAPPYLALSFILLKLGKEECIGLPEVFLLNLGDPTGFCVSTGWSTSVDFASHILLLPLLAHPRMLRWILFLTPPLRLLTWLRLGKPTLPAPVTLTDMIPDGVDIDIISQQLGIRYGNFSSTADIISSRQELFRTYVPLYFGVPYRIAAVVVGIMLYSCMQKKQSIYKTVRRFPTLSIMLMTAMWAFYHVVQQRLVVTPLAMLIHQSASRLMVAIATSVVIILTCTIEDYPSQHWISRLLRSVFCRGPLVFLQQFSYTVYMVHLVSAPVLAMLPPKFNQDRFVPEWVLFLGLKWYLLTILIGLPIWLVEKAALKGRSLLQRKLYQRSKDDNSNKKMS